MFSFNYWLINFYLQEIERLQPDLDVTTDIYTNLPFAKLAAKIDYFPDDNGRQLQQLWQNRVKYRDSNGKLRLKKLGSCLPTKVCELVFPSLPLVMIMISAPRLSSCSHGLQNKLSLAFIFLAIYCQVYLLTFVDWALTAIDCSYSEMCLLQILLKVLKDAFRSQPTHYAALDWLRYYKMFAGHIAGLGQLKLYIR